jgi:hypothetical protein
LVWVGVVDEGHVALEGVELLAELGIAVLREGSRQVVESFLQCSSTFISLGESPRCTGRTG